MTERATTGLNGLSPNAQGMIWMVISGLGFVVAHTVVRHFSFQLHPFIVTFFVMFFGTIVVLPSFLRHGLVPLHTTRLPLHLVRSLCIAIAVMSLYYALSTTPLAIVPPLRPQSLSPA